MILIKQIHQKNVTCYYWYFKDVDYRYEPHLCTSCLDFMQKAMNFNDVAIDYRIHFWYMSNNDAIDIMKNSNLNEKSGLLLFLFFTLYKMSETTYYQRNREIINRAKEYENNKEVLREKA